MYRRVAFTGPSGSGKTTLVHYVQEELGLPWFNGSSGQLKTDEQNKELESKGLVVGHGHLKVIQSGHANPMAALENQKAILESRILNFSTRNQFVTDRCTIDNWAYYLQQCAMYDTEENTESFLRRCHFGLRFLTHIIYVPPMFKTQDNGSRITNTFYQMNTVAPIFTKAVNDFAIWAEEGSETVKFLELNVLDLQERKIIINDFLNE